MKDLSVLYQSQYKKAKETLDILEKQRAQIDFNLQSNPICSILHKELRTINLDIKITANELEHAESAIVKYNFLMQDK
ncbi:hypothetical protein BC952_1907 [Flavobacterium limicola]|uniref:Uncharacterized protein n=1 Tax=Flavobacterium limicola TaxID=180441 RepID=A0A495S2K3_9FLAO|nr:hypothetical protein [Flavobacterium limicola]RKS94043.1 hypothetical protein BC952_1907 [Flavobacterium limicola]